ncbi:hypothetical protein ANCCAN_29598 [Ancylostoma caninum]|uniref:Uncharacterized protein n=1 Tax=Ancylostoma caninum TaxID=29170 RepID=A0A368EY23_ANCCA|nr:hypothetical protein ANCCAN_29598 [Ancylostoma caninum]
MLSRLFPTLPSFGDTKTPPIISPTPVTSFYMTGSLRWTC